MSGQAEVAGSAPLQVTTKENCLSINGILLSIIIG